VGEGVWVDRFLQAGAEGLVLWFAVLATLIAVAAYVVGKTRPEPSQKEPQASQLLSKFRELHSRGDLSDAEYRTIKTTLAAQFQKELKDNDQTG